MKKYLLSIIIFLSVFVGADATKIAFLCDIHVSPGNANESKLKEVVKAINSSDADVAILAGDLTNEGSDEELSNVKPILDAIAKPLYIIPGNHETTWSQSACKTFTDIWQADRFITEVDGMVLVGINCGPYMKMGDGHIKQEDLIWLDKMLSEHKGKRVISINHMPLMPDLDNYIDYIKVLEKYNVVTHLCGHYHSIKYYKGGDIDCLINRALDMRDGDYGYTEIEIVNDSIKQWNCRLDKKPELSNAFKINDNLQPMPDTVATVQEMPAGFKIEMIYRDNASIFTRLGIDGNNIYFGNSLGFVKAIDKRTGENRWEYKTEASLYSRPAVSGKYVIIPTSDKRMLWFDKKGNIINECNSDGPYVADGLVAGNVLYQGGLKKFEAWDTKSATLLWRASANNYCQACPSLRGNDIVFGNWDTNLRCLNTKDGELKWIWNNGKERTHFSPGNCVPVVANDKVIIVAPDRYMTAIDRVTGKTIWRNNSHKFRESLGVSADGKRAYAKTMDGELIAVSTEGNEYNELWMVDAKLGYEHAPCIVVESKGVVYMGSRGGVIAAVDPKTHTLLWNYRIGNSEFNGWEIDKNGDVYTSLIEGTIWKVSKK